MPVADTAPPVMLTGKDLSDDQRDSIDAAARDIMRHWPVGAITIADFRRVMGAPIHSNILGGALTDAGAVKFGQLNLRRGGGIQQVYNLRPVPEDEIVTGQALVAEMRRMAFVEKFALFTKAVAHD